MICHRSLYNILSIGLILFFQCHGAEAASKRLNKMNGEQEANKVEIVDIAAVTADNPAKAIKTITLDIPEKTIKCDVFIAGGGLGGVAAALKIWQLQQKTPLHIVLS